MILQQCIIVFITQIVFIGCRTWNVRAIARKDVRGVLISGALVHIAWLISIAIGAWSTHKIVNNFEFQYLPIVFCSLSGGLLGSYWAMKHKK